MPNKPKIIYKDDDILVCIKPSGVTSEDGRSDGVPTLLAENGQKPLLVHRLDREVGGVMVLALNSAAAAKLSKSITDGTFNKEYLAVVCGKTEPCGVLEDLLYFDRSKNKVYTVKRERAGVKKAKLEYKTLGCKEQGGIDYSLVKIKLHTGRTHQIRVQFASRKLPVAGDRRYGSRVNCQTALFSHSVEFPGKNGNVLRFEALPDYVFPWSLFKEIVF